MTVLAAGVLAAGATVAGLVLSTESKPPATRPAALTICRSGVVTFSWKQTPGAAFYNVFVDGVKVTTTPDTRAVRLRVGCGIHLLGVQAVSGKGVTSDTTTAVVNGGRLP